MCDLRYISASRERGRLSAIDGTVKSVPTMAGCAAADVVPGSQRGIETQPSFAIKMPDTYNHKLDDGDLNLLPSVSSTKYWADNTGCVSDELADGPPANHEGCQGMRDTRYMGPNGHSAR